MTAIAPYSSSAPFSQFTADEDKPLLDRVVACGEAFERGIGREFKEHCEKWFKQYRGFQTWRSAWVAASENDRDTGLREAKNEWGAQLHIPLSFRTVETLVPAAIAQRPRLLYLPRRMAWAQNVINVRRLIDYQQDNIDIDLPFQAVMRSGRIYGFGVGKTLWRKEYVMRRRVERKLLGGKLTPTGYVPAYGIGRGQQELRFDDPDFEDVDVFDFMWDPYGHDMESCSWVIHRTWRSLEYCLAKMRSGEWDTPSVRALLADGREEEHLRTMGSGQKYDEVWNARMEASGFNSQSWSTRGEHIHEVWEWHDGQQVWTALDRQLLVVAGENPVFGEKPFPIYRPTPLQKQMVGIGDMEPLEHLQRELDTLRSQMRDAATISLAVGWAYDSAAIDEEDLVFRPNAAIEVRNARPADALMPLQRPSVPNVGYQENELIRQDIDAVSGYNDGLNPQSGGAAGTATEAFLVQASLSRRIELSSRRFEIEIVRHTARNFLYLDQRMILSNRELLLPEEGMTIEQAAEAGAWRKFDVGPEGLMGDFEIRPEGGSMAARNVPQDRQDAQMFLALTQNQHIDARRATLRALELMGVDDPAGFLASQDPPLPATILQRLAQMGVDGRLIQQAVQLEQQQNPQLPPDQQGPNVQQVSQAMGAGQEAQAA